MITAQSEAIDADPGAPMLALAMDARGGALQEARRRHDRRRARRA
jgi:hypothetical protein